MGKIAGLCLLLQIPAFGGMKLHAPAADKVELRREGMGYISQKTCLLYTSDAADD